MVMLFGILWILVIYFRYVIRKQKLQQKINEVRRVPSDALAIIGVTVLMPITPESKRKENLYHINRTGTVRSNRAETMENRLLNYV